MLAAGNILMIEVGPDTPMLTPTLIGRWSVVCIVHVSDL